MKKMVLALAMVTSPVVAQEVEFLKVKVGAPPPPECPVEHMGMGLHYYSLTGFEGACVTPFGANKPAPGGLPTGPKYTLEARLTSRPAGVESIYLTVIDGLVESVHVTTDGYVHQEQIMAGLQEKFGTPSSSSSTTAKTGVGATFDAKQAEWKVGDVTVSFHGLLGRITEGSIRVSTTKGEEDFQRTYGSSNTSF